MRLKNEASDFVNIIEIEFEDRVNGIYDIFNLIHKDPSTLDRLQPVELLAVAWKILELRDYGVSSWRIIDLNGQYRAIGGNGSTWLWSLVECDVTGKAISQDHLVRLRDFLRQRHLEGLNKFDSTTIVTIAPCPPAAVLSHILRSPVELINRHTVLRWVNAVVTGNAAKLAKDYYDTVMTVGTIGLEKLEFGRILLPTDFGTKSFREIVSQLGMPASYAERMAEVGHFPLEVIHEISRNPKNMHDLSPRMFEEFIAELLARLGFDQIQLTGYSGDGGRDIIASKRLHGIPMTFFFECKKYAEGNKIQLDTIRSLLGVVAHNNRQSNIGVLVTSSRFTRGSIEMIAADARLDGKDFDGITEWLSAINTQQH
jgi:HJR/Mrr/RecB family endonuclease